MTASVTHTKVSTVPPSSDPDDITTDDWNDPHSVSISAADVGADAAGTAASAITTHEGAGNPHPTYETSAEAQGKVDTHAAASDPHTGYLKESDFTGVDFLVGTATGITASEIAVGATPGGELGNTWASPTVDATHSGSTHAATQAAAESTAASALTTHAGASDPHTGYLKESDFTGVDFLVGTATGITASEIAVGTSPGGELGGTWASPTVDSTHSGSTHAAATTTHEAASDPHTGYRKESDWFELATFSKQGVVIVTAEADTPSPFRVYNRTGRTLTFQMAAANATIGPSGSTMTVDVNVDGNTSVFGGGTKVVLPNNSGAASAVTQTTFSTTTIADGSWLSVNVDTNGGGAVQNLTVTIMVSG